MRITVRKILTLIISLCITILVLTGGSYLIKEHFSLQPLLNAIKGIDGVHGVLVEKTDGKTVLKVELSRVDNLMTTYDSIRKMVDRHIGSNAQLQILDARTPELEEAYYQIHYYLQEALVTSEFSKMKDRLNESMPNLGITRYKVYVDDARIYLQMEKNDRYMYVVLQRDSGGKTP